MSATITKVRKLIDLNAEASQSLKGEGEKLRFLATVTEWNPLPLEVVRATHADMPAYGSAHSLNTSLLVINKRAARASANGKPARNQWVVEVEWGIPSLGSISGPGGETSNSRNIRVRITNVEETVLTQQTQDSSHTPIRNAAGDLYPDPQPLTLYDTAIEVEYEADDINNGDWDAALGKMNTAEVTLTLPQGTTVDTLGNTIEVQYNRTFAAHTLLLKTADRQVIFSKTDPSKAVWSNRVLLLYREDTWDKKLPEKGYRWLVDDGSGEGVPSDWSEHAEYLDSDGKKLDAGAQIVQTAAFQVVKEHDLVTVLNTI